MAATLKTNNNYIRVKRYFIAWRTYDFKLLRNIFVPTAQYVIRNKRRTLTGIDEIEKYWMRNKRRQKDIVLRWKMIDSQTNRDEVEFYACFEDTEMQQDFKIKVCGRIVFKYNDKGRIVKLSESYRIKPSTRGTITSAKE